MPSGDAAGRRRMVVRHRLESSPRSNTLDRLIGIRSSPSRCHWATSHSSRLEQRHQALALLLDYCRNAQHKAVNHAANKAVNLDPSCSSMLWCTEDIGSDSTGTQALISTRLGPSAPCSSSGNSGCNLFQLSSLDPRV